MMIQSVREAALVGLCWLAIGILPGFGEESAKNKVRKVTATATATAHVKPDSARISFIVTTDETTPKGAREAHDKQIKKIKEALAAVPLKKVEVEVEVVPSPMTTLLAAQPNAAGVRTPQGKRARSIIYVTVREKDAAKLRGAVVSLAEVAADNGGKPVKADDFPPFRRVRRLGGLGGGDEPETVHTLAIEWLAGAGGAARRDAVRRAVREAMADAQAAVGEAKLHVLEIDVSASKDRVQTFRVRDTSDDAESSLIPIRVDVRVTCSY
jgi:uncharacterized protein YggE